MKKTIFIGAIVFLCGASTFAGSIGTLVQDSTVDCTNQVTQSDMNECAYKDLKNANEDLNNIYQALLSTLGGSEKKALIKAEKAWIGFRDSECDYEASASLGGTLHPLEIAGCQTKLSSSRTAELKKILANNLDR